MFVLFIYFFIEIYQAISRVGISSELKQIPKRNTENKCFAENMAL